MGVVLNQLPSIVLLNYLLAEPIRIPLLLVGLEAHELQVKKIVRTAVTCNLYKIIYDSNTITSTYPEEIGIACAKMSWMQIDAFITTLCDTHIKRAIKTFDAG